MISEFVVAAGRTDVGRFRSNNEDSIAFGNLDIVDCRLGRFSLRKMSIGDKGVVLGVADGVGGEAGGEVASRMTLELLSEYLAAQKHEPIGKAVLAKAIKLVSGNVRATGQTREHLSGMCSTVTVLVFNQGRALIGHIGDSRAYLLRGGEITPLTKDHSMVQEMVDAGFIQVKDAENSPYNNILLQVIGQVDDVDPVVREIELERDDVLLLCTDGLTRYLNQTEIRDALMAPMTLSEQCDYLIDTANARGGVDNISVIVAQFIRASRSSSSDNTKIKNNSPRELF